MSVSGHRNESSIKTYSKTDANTKTSMASSLMAVIDNNKNNVVAYEAGENDRNEELGLLTNSQEEFILRDLKLTTTATKVQSSLIIVNRFDLFFT